jgi:hypothetical protein
LARLLGSPTARSAAPCSRPDARVRCRVR